MSDDPDAVGYRRPPKETQFKKGQPSPNPKGRPRKVRPSSIDDEIARELDRKVTVQLDGKTKKITKRKAVAITLANKAAQGGFKEVITAMGADGRAGARAAVAAEGLKLKASDHAIIAEIFEQIQGRIIDEYEG
jgi:hypothetical protein